MTNITKTFLIILICTLTFSLTSLAQPQQDSARTSLGLHAGYAFSEGDWSKSRVVPDVNLFKGRFTFGGDLEFRLSNRLSLAVDGGYEQLDGSEWEEYVRAHGDTLNVSASFGYIGVLIQPYLKVGGPDILRLEVGPVILFPSGSEKFNGINYNYDFFSSVKFGGMGGIEYDRMLSDYMAASLKVVGIFIPSGISYADGESRTVIALPVTLGLRFYF